MCSGPSFLPSFLNSKLSKYRKLPDVTLTAPTLQTANSFATPDAVAVRTRQVPAGRAFTIDLPQHAIAVIVLGDAR